MKALIIPKTRDDDKSLSHPDEIRQILAYIESNNMTLNIDYKTLEVMWYAFSEIYDASFLMPNDYFLDEFTKMLANVDAEDAENTDVYGYCYGKLVWNGEYDPDDDLDD